MLSNHKLQVTLEEIKDIARTDLALYSDKGKLLASTYQAEEEMEDAIRLFADSMAESQMLSGCHFFKIIIEGELEYILLAKGASDDVYMVGK
ncbi:MAG: PucR family transcriptional regulator, partial [Lachnospiraceae bacterium]|nr:PucR family transcriptional regulator [Lachnospiraceae bacterium]